MPVARGWNDRWCSVTAGELDGHGTRLRTLSVDTYCLETENGAITTDSAVLIKKVTKWQRSWALA